MPSEMIPSPEPTRPLYRSQLEPNGPGRGRRKKLKLPAACHLDAGSRKRQRSLLGVGEMEGGRSQEMRTEGATQPANARTKDVPGAEQCGRMERELDHWHWGGGVGIHALDDKVWRGTEQGRGRGETAGTRQAEFPSAQDRISPEASPHPHPPRAGGKQLAQLDNLPGLSRAGRGRFLPGGRPRGWVGRRGRRKGR